MHSAMMRLNLIVLSNDVVKVVCIQQWWGIQHCCDWSRMYSAKMKLRLNVYIIDLVKFEWFSNDLNKFEYFSNDFRCWIHSAMMLKESIVFNIYIIKLPTTREVNDYYFDSTVILLKYKRDTIYIIV